MGDKGRGMGHTHMTGDWVVETGGRVEELNLFPS